MIKDNQRILNQAHVALDALTMALSFVLAYWLRFDSVLAQKIPYLAVSGRFYPLWAYARMLLILIPGYLLIFSQCNMYGPRRARRRRTIVRNAVTANVIGIAFFMMLMVLFKASPTNAPFLPFGYFRVFQDASRWFLVLFFTLNTSADILYRFLLIRLLRYFRKKGYHLTHVLLVGYSRAAELYIRRVIGNPEWGIQIHGILDDNFSKGQSYLGIPVVGTLGDLESLLRENDLDEIAITLNLSEYAKLESIVMMCEKSGVHTMFIPDYSKVISSRPYTEDLYGLPVINIRNVPLNNFFNQMAKRAVDIFGSVVAIVLFAIPMLVVAALVKATSKGPVIFKQTRVGLHNKEFSMYKFRSMEQQPPEKERIAWTTIHDARVTPVGRFIRRTSLDELPQLFNVLKGDMSLVGPRPERPFFVEKFKEEIPRYMIKHQVRPGITGWAQVNGYRGDTSIRLRIEYDLYYIENWSMGLDFKILFLTFFKGFVNKNAY